MSNNYKTDLQQSKKATNVDDVIDVYFAEPIGMAFSKLFIKLKIKPNTISFFSLAAGVIGAVGLYFSQLWINAIGVFLIILASIFDCSDGQVARLTKTFSAFGRWLDGAIDTLVYAAIYIALGLRLMGEPIPFTNTLWSFWIWPLLLFCGAVLHPLESKAADYLRTVHLAFAKDSRTCDLTRAKIVYEQLKNSKGFEKFRLKSYYSYTKSQEKMFPQFQKLLDKVEQSNGEISIEVKERFSAESSKIIRLTTLITFNLRTYVLFVLLFLKLHVFIFAFTILVLEPIRFWLKYRYQKIAKQCLEKGFGEE